MGFSKPYAILQRGRERYYTRRGTRIQEAARDELLRLFQTSGQIHYEVTPMIKGRYEELDFTRIVNFFRHNQINQIDILGWKDAEIKRFLKNKEVLVEYQGKLCPTVVGALLFAKKPSYLLGYSGITVTKFANTERDYNYVDFRLGKPIMNTFSEHGEKEKSGLIDEALEKIKSIILEKSSATLKGAVRVVDYPYLEEFYSGGDCQCRCT
ncbi:MAG: hypothetical protein LWW98_09600 [Deltaproteobacteria bacterium]|nr:hypothetical protein [Deltaproteobacteria bacterium]